MTRYRPQDGLFELGIFGGVIFPSTSIALEMTGAQHREYKTGGELGLRLAYFPIDFLGVETEGAMVATAIKNGGGAGMGTFRGHLIGQLTSWSITPFLLVGAGALGANSHEMGKDTDFAFHFGAGVKLPFDDFLSARLDVRDTITSASKQTSASSAHSPEILLGLTFTLDRSKPKAAPLPPADTDGDGIPDTADRCPNDKGAPPDGCPPDTDRDGIIDTSDQCPNQAGPAPTGCPPPPDSDGDGVLDTADECPTIPGNMKNGCPDPDPDHDGITSDKDKCPDQPETMNGYQDDDGCPDELPEAVKKFTGVMQGIEFEFGQAAIRPVSYAILDKAAETLVQYPELKISIVGHTDNVGAHDHNVELSRKRAEAVKAYLVGKKIDAARIQAEGAGPDKPLSTENTPAARAKNRRIEFSIITR
jgi:outer membrane protein OmpA-like peptidoglycan-associated protein